MPGAGANTCQGYLVSGVNLRCRGARFGAEEGMWSFGLVLRAVPGSRTEAVCVTIVGFGEVIGRTSPVTVVVTKWFIVHALYHSCVLFCAPSTDELIYMLNWLMT